MKRLLAVALLVALPAAADWDISRGANEMDKRQRLFLSVDGDKAYPGRIFREKRPSLVIRCEAGKAELIVVANTHIAGPNDDLHRHRLRVRFDDGKPESINANKATDSEGAFFPNPRPLIKRMLTAKTMMVEVVPYQYGASVSTFPMQGLERHRETLARECGVK